MARDGDVDGGGGGGGGGGGDGGGGGVVGEFRSVRDFSVGALIGKGGFSKVYRARVRGRADGPLVALKVMNRAWLREKKLEGRVRDEVALHRSRSGHKRVVRLLGHFEDKAHVYLVLELCEKGNLYQFLKRHKPLDPRLVRRWFREVVEAVAYLHENDVVHRDIKLSNILLTKDGHVKLADFGLAARIEGREHHTVCGTPNYMAPEVRFHDQKRGAPYDPVQADLWSLGCLLYALLHDGAHLGPGEPYVRTERVVDDRAHNLLCTLLSEVGRDRSSAAQVLRHGFLRHGERARPAEARPVADRLSYVRIDTGSVRGVQHVFGSHKVEIQRDGTVLIRTAHNKQGRRAKEIVVREWMPERYAKLQQFCAKAVAILRDTTPRVVLKQSRPEPLVAAVVDGVGHVWFRDRGLSAEYDLLAESPVVRLGDDRAFRLDVVGPVASSPSHRGHIPARGEGSGGGGGGGGGGPAPTPLSGPARDGGLSLARLAEQAVVRCVEIEAELHRERVGEVPLYYPVIVHDEQVSVKGVGTGLRTEEGHVNVHLEDGTTLQLDKTGSVVTCAKDSFALVRGAHNQHLPSLPPALRGKLRLAQAVIGRLVAASA